MDRELKLQNDCMQTKKKGAWEKTPTGVGSRRLLHNTRLNIIMAPCILCSDDNEIISEMARAYIMQCHTQRN